MGYLTRMLSVTCLFAWALVGCESAPDEARQPTTTTAPATKESHVTTEKALFGAGCFWGVETTFRKVPGVIDVAVGYAGGKTSNPTYEQICNDETGHAEVVQVEYDPAKVNYQTLLYVFFENHDPTTLNRQGPDVGTQYRSAIFFQNPEQERLARAEKEKRNKSGEYVGPIVTEVSPAVPFWRGEEYHQQYFAKQGVDWSCHTGNGKKRKGIFG